MSVTCNKLTCDIGHLDLESILLSLFAKNAEGCVGIKLVQLTGDCDTLTDLRECASNLTTEQAIKMAIVDDGCGGLALGVFTLSGDAPAPEPR